MAEAGPKKPRDPFIAPLDGPQLRGFFRRLHARPWAEQQAFVARVNWNLVDPGTEYHLMSWLAMQLESSEPERQAFALATLGKLPHFKRGRHAERFKRLMPRLDTDLATRLAEAFGPVLGGPPKRPKGKPAAAPKVASVDDLSKLKDFFGKFGGAR
ncbi:MAG TPA: hypothetical protein V6D47_09965 [Oscillatoriaceae cyanobacterium]